VLRKQNSSNRDYHGDQPVPQRITHLLEDQE
jgi:hypothetical protein